MLTMAVLALVFALLLTLLRAHLGPTIFDRVLAVNTFGNTAVLLLALYSFLSRQMELLDVALVYALVNFLGLIALMRFSTFGTFATGQAKDERK